MKSIDLSAWLRDHWRPVTAITYLVICVFDFIIHPIGFSGAQIYQNVVPTVPWVPLTLQGGGLFHVSMGAILGVSAWGRSKEKLALINLPEEDVDVDKVLAEKRKK